MTRSIWQSSVPTSEQDVSSYLSQKGKWRWTRDEAIGLCPCCRGGTGGELSLSVNITTGVWVCNRKNNCGRSGTFWQLRQEYGDVTERPRLIEIAAEGKVVNLRPVPPLNDRARDLLQQRGLSDHVIDAWGVGADRAYFAKAKAEQPALAWPVYDPLTSKVVNVKYRSAVAKDFANSKGGAKWPIGCHLVPKDAKTLIVLEGEYDAMSAWQYGHFNAVSLPNGAGDQTWIELAWDWLERFDTIILGTDADAAGTKALGDLVKRLGHKRTLRQLVLPAGKKDLNECLMDGVSREEVAAAIANAQEIKPENIHWADHWSDAVVALFNDKGDIDGAASGIVGLDRMLRGFRPGELTVWTGASGSGKSTVLAMIALYMRARGERSAFASMELPAAKNLRWMVLQATGSEKPTAAEVRTALGWIAGGVAIVDHLGPVDLEKLAEWLGYCAARYGCRQLVVDSLQLVTAGWDENKANKAVVMRLLQVASEFGAHIHLVAHPRKAENDQHEVNKVDVKGSSSITDLAHNVVAVIRRETATVLRVLKNREHGITGDAAVVVDAACKQVFEASVGPADFWPLMGEDDTWTV